MPVVLLRDTPPAVCDNCGRACFSLHQAGGTCYHCHAGVFVHRSAWVFWTCPCGGDPQCADCDGKGVIATPAD